MLLRSAVLLGLALPASCAVAQVTNFTTEDAAVQVRASALDTGDSLRTALVWKSAPMAKEYRVSRRIGTTAWFTLPQPVPASSSGADLTFSESLPKSLLAGRPVEYRVAARGDRRISVTLKRQDGTPYDTLYPVTIQGMGFAEALPAYDPAAGADGAGAVLILVDETMADSLAAELARLREDYAELGRASLLRRVPRAEEFSVDKVFETKQVVLDAVALNPSISHILLLGRVPVPYSGDIFPDGHTDHRGAWPADVFYADLNDARWTDVSVNNSSATRTENHNVPGDGKFDQGDLSSAPVAMSLGRVDAYNLPLFEESEAELLRRWLDKRHAWHAGQIQPATKILVDENFPSHVYPEAFAAPAWRGATTALDTADIVRRGKWRDSVKNNTSQPYHFAFANGPGWYTSAHGAVESKDFVEAPNGAVFSFIFGSYHGDWDHRDALLRSAIFGSGSVLSSAWSGRPPYSLHIMRRQATLGEVVRYAWNFSTYAGVVIENHPLYSQSIQYVSGQHGTFVALHGDPTLTLHPPSPPPVVVSSRREYTRSSDGSRRLELELMPADGNTRVHRIHVRALNASGTAALAVASRWVGSETPPWRVDVAVDSIAGTYPRLAVCAGIAEGSPSGPANARLHYGRALMVDVSTVDVASHGAEKRDWAFYMSGGVLHARWSATYEARSLEIFSLDGRLIASSPLEDTRGGTARLTLPQGSAAGACLAVLRLADGRTLSSVVVVE